VGSVEIPVRCSHTNKQLKVHYETRDGTAKKESEYKHAQGTLTFGPSVEEEVQTVKIEIVDDEDVEEDMEFYIDLTPEAGTNVADFDIVGPTLMVTVIDDDEPGVLSWESEQVGVQASGDFELKVRRREGASGELKFNVKTEESTAKEGVDFVAVDTEVTMANQELESVITIAIPPEANNRDRTGKEFRVIMSDLQGGARFCKDADGDEKETYCTVVFDPAKTQSLVIAKIKAHINEQQAEQCMLSSKDVNPYNKYSGQFKEAMFCGGSLAEQKLSSWGEFFIHLLCFPWKLMCAFVPPPSFAKGYITFLGALACIGLQTALIKDLAELVGCCFDVPDAVTATTIVALGTSLPDTFASKIAAEQDEYADSSVTNVTGSNSVNVFMGLGIPWMIGSIYWSQQGRTQEWVNRISTQFDGKQLVLDHPEGGLIHYGDELGVSLMTYSSAAFVALGILHWRRKKIGGEFGGPDFYKYGTTAVFFSLWGIYVGVTSWYSIRQEAYWIDQGYAR